MEMDIPDFIHRQETEILKMQIREIGARITSRPEEPAVIIREFSKGTLGATFGTIGIRFRNVT